MSKVLHLFENITEQQPHQYAVSYLSEQISYASLNASANRLARYLIHAGVRPGNFIPIIAEKSIETIILN